MDAPFFALRLSKTYGDFHLGLDLELSPGITALYGPNGSGKSTALDCIAGLVSPDSGELRLSGRALFSSQERVNLPPERRRIGYVFQDSLLFPHLTVWENILYGHRRTPEAHRRIETDALVELLGLEPLLNRKPTGLSGGEARRVALARAIATSPELLLLDEPLASLDNAYRGRALRSLKTLRRQMGLSMLYVSHSISEVLALADQAIALKEGAVVASGTPHGVLRHPGVRTLVAEEALENLLEVDLVEHRAASGLTQARLATHDLWLPQVDGQASGTVTVSIRAADILLASEPPRGLSARNVLRGTVAEVGDLGPATLVTADIGVPLLAEVSPEARESLGLEPGRDVFLIIKANSIAVLG